MTPERWAQVRTVFESALEHAAGDDRAVFLQGACNGDKELLAEVRELLASFTEAPDFMSQPVTGAANMRRAAGLHDCGHRRMLLRKPVRRPEIVVDLRHSQHHPGPGAFGLEGQVRIGLRQPSRRNRVGPLQSGIGAKSHRRQQRDK